MATLYIDTGGTATNSGSRDANGAALSGTADAVVTGSVVQLTVGTDLSSVNATAGSPTQDTIYINDATNANRKIFWITAKDDTLDQVTVDVAPTGVTASNWAIGGRYAAPGGNGLNLIDGALRAGDVVQVNNSPAAGTVDWITSRTAGTPAAGYIKIKGATGVRPLINITNTTQPVKLGAFALWWLENLELDQDGASGNAVNMSSSASGCVFYNVKVSDAGGVGLSLGAAASRAFACEVAGVGGDAVSMTSGDVFVHGLYLHDVAADGIEQSSSNNTRTVIEQTIIDSCAGRGVYWSGAPTITANMFWLNGLTVYGCGNSGLEIADADAQVTLINSIFSENGNAAGEYNVEWVAGDAEKVSFHGWNVFFHSGGGGGANLSNLTVNAQVASSEFTTDPAFTNAAGGDFSISTSSPAKATGFPGQFLGGSLGYLDIGAVQIVAGAGTGGGGPLIGGRLVQ